MSFRGEFTGVRAYLLVGLAAVVAHHWVTSEYWYWAVAIYACIGLWAGALRQRPSVRSPWVVLAAGVTLFTAGDIAWYVLDMLGPVPASPNVSDWLYLAAYPTGAAALLLLSREVSRSAVLTIDALIVSIALAIAIWPLLFATVLHGNSQPLGTRLTVGTYPCWDILYLVLAVRIAASRALHTRRSLLLVGSVVLFLLGDIFWFKSVDTYALGDWMDSAWLAAYVGFAGAALHPSALTRDRVEQPRETGRYLLLAAPLALLPLGLVGEFLFVRRVNLVDACLFSALLLLVLGRMAIIVRGLDRAQTELREQNRLKDELISVVSHDLRTPLTSIMGYLELALADDTDPDSMRDFLEVVKRNTSRLHRLVEDLLFVSRVQSGREALELAPLHIGVLVEETVAAAVPTADAADVLLRSVVLTNDVVLADGHRISEVLENLLSNAIKFTPPGGRVDVWAGREGETLVLRVADTGVGICEEDCRHLFDRFFRATGAEGVPGAGLGLSIVKAIVDAHEGTVTVASTPGAGTTFEVRLPLLHAGEAAPVPVAA